MNDNLNGGSMRVSGRCRPLPLLTATLERWYDGRPFELGAALAYYAVFSIAPLLLLAIAVASLFLGRGAAEGQITQQLENTFGPTVAHAIESTLEYSNKSGSGTWATVVSIVVLLVGATALFTQIQSALNAVWGVRPKPGLGWLDMLRGRLFAFLAMLGSIAIVLVVQVANTAVLALMQFLPPGKIPASLPIWQMATLGMSFIFLTLAVALIYRLLPDVTLAWRHIWLGAAVSAVLAMIGNYMIGLYLSWSGVTTAYGAAGSLVVIMLWVFYLAQVLLLGAEFIAVYTERCGVTVKPRENAESIALGDGSKTE